MSSSIKALQDFVFTSKYARWIPELNRRETYNEAVDRVGQMMMDKYCPKSIDQMINDAVWKPSLESIDSLRELRQEIEWAYDMMRKKRILGSQRALQFGGDPVIKKNARIFNCCYSHCDRERFFQEYLWLLLCGCGCGFSVQKHHIAKLPNIVKPMGSEVPFVISDSIEGWADALGLLMSSYFSGDKRYKFDYSEIRPKGSSLSSGVGKAPGPEGLRNALNKIRDLLEDRTSRIAIYQLKPIDVYDICMHTADAVLSGGVRRSATIALFSPDDHEMATAKTGNWFNENPQRARSNNSAVLVRGQTSKEEFAELMNNVKEFGEPGFVWVESPEAGFNPCFDPNTRINTNKGLVKIKDLCNSNNIVICDNRIDKNGINKNNFGTVKRQASKAKITQKYAKVFKVQTEHGHELFVTDNHTFITTEGRKQLKNCKIGDVIPIQSGEGHFGNFGNYNQGLLLGILTGDGTFSSKGTTTSAHLDIWEDDFSDKDIILDIVNKELHQEKENIPYGDLKWINQNSGISTIKKSRCGGVRLNKWLENICEIKDTRSIKTKVPECVWRGSKDFIIGYIAGMIFSDGSVQLSGHKKKATLSIRINQSNKKLLQEIQILLNNLGIVSKIYLRREKDYRLLPDGLGSHKKYLCKDNYDLIINRPNSIKLEGLLFGRKNNDLKSKLDQRGRDCKKQEKFLTKITKIEFSHNSDVYCLNEDVSNSVIANGIAIGQCVEIQFFPYYPYDKEKFEKWKETSETEAITCDPAEIGLESCWHFCNLTTTNCSKLHGETKEEKIEYFLESVKASAIVGTLQAGFTKFDYLTKASEKLAQEEALLGVSMTGIMDNYEIILDPDVQKKAAKLVLKINKEIADKIGIKTAARATCLKPEGTGTLILGSSAHGCHPHHYTRYLRAVQANTEDNVYKYFKESNGIACEPSKWSANKTDDIVYFPIEVPDGAKTKNQLPAVEMLKIVKSTQQNWVKYGKRKDRCLVSWLDHNVSNTVTIQLEEWDEVTDFIYSNRHYFSGISLVPDSADKDYPQAPNCAVYTANQIVREYGDAALWTSGLIELALQAWNGDLWDACSALVNNDFDPTPTPSKENPVTFAQLSDAASQKRFWEKSRKFANKYFDQDYKRLSYCMKDVYNWKKYTDLRDNMKVIEYTNLIENQDHTTLEEEIACAGGVCLV